MRHATLVLALVWMSSVARAQTASIKELAWLQECWEQRDGDRVVNCIAP